MNDTLEVNWKPGASLLPATYGVIDERLYNKGTVMFVNLSHKLKVRGVGNYHAEVSYQDGNTKVILVDTIYTFCKLNEFLRQLESCWLKAFGS